MGGALACFSFAQFINVSKIARSSRNKLCGNQIFTRNEAHPQIARHVEQRSELCERDENRLGVPGVGFHQNVEVFGRPRLRTVPTAPLDCARALRATTF